MGKSLINTVCIMIVGPFLIDSIRTIAISADGVTVASMIGGHGSACKWKPSEIDSARLVGQAESGRKFGLMILFIRGGGVALIGIPKDIAIGRVARCLDELGVTTTCPEKPFGARERPNLRAAATAVAEVSSLPQSSAVSIRSRFHRAVVLILAWGVISLVLAGTGLGLLFILWNKHKTPGFELLAITVGVMVGGVLAALFTNTFSEILVCRYLRWIVARAVWKRADSIVLPDSEDAVFVLRFPRDRWRGDKVFDVDEAGFMRVDTATQTLLFEGAAERWKIPIQNIDTVQLYEVEWPYLLARSNGDTQHVLVLEAQCKSGCWETGIYKPWTRIAESLEELSRRRNAGALYDRLEVFFPRPAS